MNDDAVLAERIDLLMNNLVDAEIHLKDSLDRVRVAVAEVYDARAVRRLAFELLRDEMFRVSLSKAEDS